ncbi:MAG: ACP S-malonyltransferase [Planctomycetota bacterium]
MTQTPSPIVILCPGQGAQKVGMAAAWANASPAAKAVFDEAADVLGYDLLALCTEGPAETLDRTDRAQPAILAASVASYRGLVEQGKLDPANLTAAAGLSLGEFTALHLAGALSLADALTVVQERGRVMQAAAEAVDSSMVALTGEVEESVVRKLCDDVKAALGANAVLEPANFNSPMQVVVSGTRDACDAVLAPAQDAGLKATPLAVAGAFHSPIMAPAAEALAKAMASVSWSTPACRVESNALGGPHDPDPVAIQTQLVAQLTAPVRWSQSIAGLADSHAQARWVELAPGKVLSGLLRRINRSVKAENFDSP